MAGSSSTVVASARNSAKISRKAHLRQQPYLFIFAQAKLSGTLEATLPAQLHWSTPCAATRLDSFSPLPCPPWTWPALLQPCVCWNLTKVVHCVLAIRKMFQQSEGCWWLPISQLCTARAILSLSRYLLYMLLGIEVTIIRLLRPVSVCFYALRISDTFSVNSRKVCRSIDFPRGSA